MKRWRLGILGLLLAAVSLIPAMASAQPGISLPLNVESIQSNPAATPPAMHLVPFQIDPRSARARANAFDRDPVAKRIELGQALADRAGLSCRVSDSIGLGLTPDDHEVREIACDLGPGYVVTSSPQPSSLNCILLAKARTRDMSATVPECVLEQNLQVVAVIDRMVRASDANCVVKAADWLASSPEHDFYEARCEDDRGIVVRADRAGGIHTRSCVSALRIGVTCRMTDAPLQAAMMRERQLSLVGRAGFSCRDTKDRFVGEEQGGQRRDVIELGCTNRDLGLVAFVPGETENGVEVIDCISANARGVTCVLTPPERILAALSEQVQPSEPNCQVTDFTVGRMSPDRMGEYAQIDCADGREGSFILPFRRSAPATRL